MAFVSDAPQPPPTTTTSLLNLCAVACCADMCMVFEMLGDNLLTLIKAYKYRGIPIEIVRNIIRSVSRTLYACRGVWVVVSRSWRLLRHCRCVSAWTSSTSSAASSTPT
jgi:hypothetical protein